MDVEQRPPRLPHPPLPPRPPGFLVARCRCSGAREALRQRALEQCMSAVAASPYARAVQCWCLGGVSGACLTALAVAALPSRAPSVAGVMLLSFPLLLVRGREGRGG
jgi:hypothetical protein